MQKDEISIRSEFQTEKKEHSKEKEIVNDQKFKKELQRLFNEDAELLEKLSDKRSIV